MASWWNRLRGSKKNTVRSESSGGEGPSRRKANYRSTKDNLFSRDSLIQTLDANLKTRDYLWRGRPGHAGIAYRMYTDSVVQNANNIRVHPLISNQAIWRVEPPPEPTEREREASRFMEWMLMNCMNWNGFLRFVGNHRHKIGVANCEFTDEVQPISRDAFPNHPNPDGAIVVKGFAPIPPWSIKEYVPGRGLQAQSLVQYVQGGSTRTINIQDNLILRFTVDQEGKNYFGKATARGAYGDWSQKILMQVVRLMKHERFGLGTPYAKEPENVGNDERDMVNQFLEELRANENGFFSLPFGWEIDLFIPHIEHGTNMSGDIGECNIGVYSAFTNSVASLGTGKFGSNALADTQDNHLDNAIEADAADIASVINHGVDGWSLIGRYTNFNYPGARLGRLVGSNFSQSANYKYMEMVYKLVSSGAVRPSAELEAYLLEKLVAPKPEKPFDERIEPTRRQFIESESTLEDETDNNEEEDAA